MEINYRQEKMSDIFVKHHFSDSLVFHQMLGPDVSDPHDHPWGFETTILRGGYIEEVYTVLPDGSWRMRRVHRKPGDRIYVAAERIHRIVELPQGECWTMVTPQPAEREWKYWRFDQNGVRSRHWWEPEFDQQMEAA